MREAVKNIKDLWKFRNVRLNTDFSPDMMKHNKSGSDEHPDWTKAVGEAEKIVGYPTSFLSLRFLLSDEFANVAFHLRRLVGTSHPLLRTLKDVITQNGRPNYGLVVLLVAKAGGFRGAVLENDVDVAAGVLHKQRALAEIVEMLHTSYTIHASLLNMKGRDEDLHYGNKISLLSGDYILSRCFHVLAGIRNQELNEIVSSALRDLSECDFVGPRDSQNAPLPAKPALGEEVAVPDVMDSTPFQVDRFLGKPRSEWTLRTLLASAGLLGKCCRGALKLAGHDEDVQRRGYVFGRNFALAWHARREKNSFLQEQTGPFSLVSAPVLFQLGEEPSLYDAVAAKDVDYDAVRLAVLGGNALEKTQGLQEEHHGAAVEVLRDFPAGEARNALRSIADAVAKSAV